MEIFNLDLDLTFEIIRDFGSTISTINLYSPPTNVISSAPVSPVSSASNYNKTRSQGLIAHLIDLIGSERSHDFWERILHGVDWERIGSGSILTF